VAFQSVVKPRKRMGILPALTEMEKFLSACNFREILFPGHSPYIETCLRRRSRPEVSIITAVIAICRVDKAEFSKWKK
jgi:hypothetical protein